MKQKNLKKSCWEFFPFQSSYIKLTKKAAVKYKFRKKGNIKSALRPPLDV